MMGWWCWGWWLAVVLSCRGGSGGGRDLTGGSAAFVDEPLAVSVFFAACCGFPGNRRRCLVAVRLSPQQLYRKA